jgi:uncharacterized protein with PIN domain
MLGFDALFVQNLPLLEIIKMGLDQKRIILSRNLKLIKHPRVTHAYLVKSYTPLEQIKDLVQALDLSGMIAPFTRCLLCNGLLEKTKKEQIAKYLEPGTKRDFNEFYMCTGCKKIYWKGSHYEKMMAFIHQNFFGSLL